MQGTAHETRASAQADMFEYIKVFYTRNRRHYTLGYCSQFRFPADWIIKQAGQQFLASHRRPAG